MPEAEAWRSLAEGFACAVADGDLGPRFLLAFFLLGMTMRGGGVRCAHATDGGSRCASNSGRPATTGSVASGSRSLTANRKPKGITYKRILIVKGPGVGCEGRGDSGVRFDRLNELGGRRGRSLSLSKGRGRGKRVSAGTPSGCVRSFDLSTFQQAQGIASSGQHRFNELKGKSLNLWCLDLRP